MQSNSKLSVAKDLFEIVEKSAERTIVREVLTANELSSPIYKWSENCKQSAEQHNETRSDISSNGDAVAGHIVSWYGVGLVLCGRRIVLNSMPVIVRRSEGAYECA